MDGCTWTWESTKQIIITQCAGSARAMLRSLHGLREERDGKRSKARASLEKASWKMTFELGLEQSSTYGIGEDIEANGQIWRTQHQIWGQSRPRKRGA